MSQFVRHEPCPGCGSKDNLARYDDGHGHCFGGCGHWEPPTVSAIFERLRAVSQKEPIVKTFNANNLLMPPDDTSKFLGVPALQWLAKYGILFNEAKEFLWSEERKWLIYPLYSARALRDHGAKILIAWQARNFSKLWPKPKYLSRGPIGDCLHILGPEKGTTLILVEDVISAIKVARGGRSVYPLFGSNISLKMLTMLTTRFRRLGVWLDMDKAKESLKTTSRASQLGYEEVFSVITEKDPKEYTNEEINIQLQGRE